MCVHPVSVLGPRVAGNRAVALSMFFAGLPVIPLPEMGERRIDAFCGRPPVADVTFVALPVVQNEGYAKVSLKKYRPMAARNEDGKVFNGLL
jgi:hypothetical protein